MEIAPVAAGVLIVTGEGVCGTVNEGVGVLILGDSAEVSNGGRLGTGREAGVSIGNSDVTVIVGKGVDCGSSTARRVVFARRRGGGLIGRTASKYWVPALDGRVGVSATVADGVAGSAAA